MDIEQWFYSLPLRVRSLFHPRQVNEELKAELRDHLEQQVRENIENGMPPDEARMSAMRTLGGLAQIEQQCRDARGTTVVEDFLQDFRFGFRQLSRNPGFSLLAVLCLTLGIGANAAVFSWLEGILFRPYPLVAHQDRLLALDGTTRDSAEGTEVSWPDFLDLQRNCTLIDSFILSKITGATLSIGE